MTYDIIKLILLCAVLLVASIGAIRAKASSRREQSFLRRYGIQKAK